MLRTTSPRKSGAKVGIKKKSLEFRDSFGTDGTLSVLSVQIRYYIRVLL